MLTTLEIQCIRWSGSLKYSTEAMAMLTPPTISLDTHSTLQANGKVNLHVFGKCWTGDEIYRLWREDKLTYTITHSGTPPTGPTSLSDKASPRNNSSVIQKGFRQYPLKIATPFHKTVIPLTSDYVHALSSNASDTSKIINHYFLSLHEFQQSVWKCARIQTSSRWFSQHAHWLFVSSLSWTCLNIAHHFIRSQDLAWLCTIIISGHAICTIESSPT